MVHEIKESGILYGHRFTAHKDVGSAQTGQTDTDFLDVGCKQGKSRQCSRTDGKALTRSGCRIAQRIERIGTLTHLLAQTGHFRIAAGIVGDRTVSVRGQCNAQRGKHAYGSDTDAVKSQTYIGKVETGSKKIGSNDAHHYGNYRNGSREHTQTDTRDNDSSWPRLAALTQFPGGAVRLGSIVFRGTTDNDAYHQPHNHRAGYPHPVVQLQQPKDKESGNDYQHRTQVRTESKGVQQVLHPGILFGTHGEDAYNRKDNPHSGNQHRGNDGFELHQRIPRMDKSGCAKSRRSKNGAAITLVKVGPHTGNVAHVIAYIVGNGCGIAGIVFRDAGFHFAHKVGAYIGGFRIDTTAHACKQRLCGSSHTERQHRSGDNTKFMSGCHHIHRDNRIEQQIPEGYIEQAKPHYNQPHYRTAAESDAQTRIQ